ncbi:hypothetical protein D3C77_407190 [compost metagenome]
MLEVYEEKLGLLHKHEELSTVLVRLGELIADSELSAVHKERARSLLDQAEQL